MFWNYNQNNSGGRFDCDDNVCEYVIIEADNVADANSIAESVGIYFDGVNACIDCECCGDRWLEAWSNEGTAEPMICGEPVTKTWRLKYCAFTDPVVIVHYKDGRKLVVNK